ncbi:geranylgeranyl diphosphate synthase, type II [Algoriphagus faecimaris]|uniref:Geranylgeranyl diphosphate synthase, type II n=1 Tax=Algoriphagus faecimaris TaxID=686796 RepID=A0A1G6MYV0_9BACT|nr:polyprenyl synthetase family protein [Algoriphagus faecimaris]SDC60377.1 geranylgeranyl diphosphate synthase, type II [Algoriphagus faecimaris]
MTKKSPTHELLSNLENFLAEENFGDSPKELYQPIRYILSLGGKRIRPLLALLSYGLYQDDPEKILGPAAAIEVFHNFTLMHDDIMDEAPLRRGKATVHEKWNSNVAILSGDVMLIRAYDLLLKSDHQYLPEVIQRFNKTAAEVCEGQQLDMNFETRDEVHEEEYLSMIRLKTAVLLGHALELGALLAGASKSDLENLYEFGVNIGIGFQLKDDLLDIFADQAKFGKQVGGDIISNKKTFLLIKALEIAKGEDLKELMYWLSIKEFDKTEKVDAVKALYEKLGIRQLTEEKMDHYFSKGFDLFESINYQNPVFHETLLELTQGLIHREK